MGITLHEATLLAWKGKYQYNVVRPVTFIRQYINKQWSPLIATPPHPEFPAAHATFSNAAATALCTLFGETCQLTDKTYTDIGMNERTYSTLQDAAHEAGYSRLYGGIHYRYSIEQGFLLGEAAARHVDKSVQFKAKTPGAAFSTPN
jgi:membrane-associated phospholipid phosphatase